jgi:hypothetical protein
MKCQPRAGAAPVGPRAFYIEDPHGAARHLLCDPDARLTFGCQFVLAMDGQWFVGTCTTKHPERAKWISGDCGATPHSGLVGGLKRGDLARVVAILQTEPWDRTA